MKQAKIITTLIVAAIVLAAVWLSFSTGSNLREEKLAKEMSQAQKAGSVSLTEEPTEALSEENIVEKASLVVDDGLNPPNVFELEVVEESTAFGLLQASGLTLSFKEYDFGLLIEAIGDKKNGDDGKYWLYYLNGQMPSVSADKQIIKAGDKVEFKFEKSVF